MTTSSAAPLHEDARPIFRDLAREVCRDGRVSPEEFQLLREVAQVLRLPLEEANAVVNQAVGEYRAGALAEANRPTPRDLYRRLLLTLTADGCLDAPEHEAIVRLQQVLQVPDELAEPPAAGPPKYSSATFPEEGGSPGVAPLGGTLLGGTPLGGTSLGGTSPKGVAGSTGRDGDGDPPPPVGPEPASASPSTPAMGAVAGVIGEHPRVAILPVEMPSPAGGVPVGGPARPQADVVRPTDKGGPAPAPGRLQPLSCPRCQGAVPLVRAPATSCPYCRQRIEIPAATLEALTAREALDSRKRNVSAFLAALGQRPGPVGRAVAMIPESLLAMLVLALMIYAPWKLGLASPTFLPLFRLVEAWRHENLLDLLSLEHRVFLLLFPYFLALVLPLYLQHRLRRRVVTLAKLQVAMVAGAPKVPGGPAICRQCGGPLHVPENAVGVTCVYCSTDNLVGVPPEVTAIAHRHARLVGMDFQKAQEAYLRETLMGWESVLALSLGYIALSLIFIWGGKELQDGPDWPPPFRAALRSREALRPMPGQGADLRLEAWTDLLASSGVVLRHWVPLRAGEELTVTWRPSGLPRPPSPVALRVPARVYLERSFRLEGQSELLREAALTEGQALSASARLGGWYRLELGPPDGRPWQVRPVIAPGR